MEKTRRRVAARSRSWFARCLLGSVMVIGASGPPIAAGAAPLTRPYPILFVTQLPIPYDFTAVASVFGNHRGSVAETGRGGDLWILYPDGSTKNLTAAAGYGVASGFQGATSIAVREPCVDWSGTKAIFSMVVGAPTQQYQWGTYFWQLYEISGLGPTDIPVITLVPGQPANYNNIAPCYLGDGRIVFSSDRPRGGEPHLFPQLDEYEEAATVSGLWSLDPTNGELRLLDHAPSGDFKPTVDSFGRVVFTRWDHLQRDQQADADALDPNGDPYGTFNSASEAIDAPRLASRDEVFPEPRAVRTDLLLPHEEGHSFNHFFPWVVEQNGTGLETLSHIGRHELHSYFNRSFNNDGNLVEFIAAVSGRFNEREIFNFLQTRESPTTPGTYFGIDAPEFYTHAAGQIVSMPGDPAIPADQIAVTYWTDRDTASFTDSPGPCHSGLYRNPLPLSDGSLLSVHAGERSPGVAETRLDQNTGTRALPGSRYQFRLRALVPAAGGCAGYQSYGTLLTPGISKTLWYWDPDVRVDYVNMTMWELDPVEVRPRTPPISLAPLLEAPEAQVFATEGVDVETFRGFLEEKGLALVVARNVTTRDAADRQQPFNLRVPGGVQTIGAGGSVYDVSYLQFFQADQIRGLGGTVDPRPGRRVLAQVMHDRQVKNPPGVDVAGAVELGLDGSMAALVPAHRALSWQLTDEAGTAVVRERYWISFQPGEIRLCTSCHGLNSADQAGSPRPSNEPQALHQLLQFWKTMVFYDGFEGGSTATWSGVSAP